MTGYREILMIAVLVTAGLFPEAGKAQDAHYWTLQYGTRSTLLGGSVIGSVEDLGATYYNPARLASTSDLSFLLSAKVYQFDKVTVEDGAGEGVDARSSSFGGAPSLVAGTFKIGFLPGHHFAYETADLANISSHFRQAFLGCIQFFQDHHGNKNIVFLETEQ